MKKVRFLRLLNEEFEWEKMSSAGPIVGPAFRIESEWVKNARQLASGIVVEMLKASSETGIDLVAELANSIVSEVCGSC